MRKEASGCNEGEMMDVRSKNPIDLFYFLVSGEKLSIALNRQAIKEQL